jgi:hypothetical protein
MKIRHEVWSVDAEVAKSTEEYVSFLEGKGFTFGNDAIGFIYFGKRYTDASDILVNAAIELTLKVQKNFDGSFYISFLDRLQKNRGCLNKSDFVTGSPIFIGLFKKTPVSPVSFS